MLVSTDKNIAAVDEQPDVSDVGKPVPGAITMAETAFWFFLIATLWTFNGYIKWVEYEFSNIEVHSVRLVTNEASSGIAALISVLFVRAWLNRFPLSGPRLFITACAHALGSVLFSLMHVGLMMTFRSLTYAALGWVYHHAIPDGDFGFFKMLAYEYGKDLPVYGVFLGIILSYRLYKSRHAFVAGVKKQTSPPPPKSLDTQIMVKAGKDDILVKLSDIDWFQSSANYVQVFTGGREYLIRSSLSDIEEKLTGLPFQRVHRSFIVNLVKVEKIVSTSSGQYRLNMADGSHIPVGRKYKDELYDRISM